METAGIKKLTMNKEYNVVSVGMMTVCGVVGGWKEWIGFCLSVLQWHAGRD
jgi:hypothetical protein